MHITGTPGKSTTVRQCKIVDTLNRNGMVNVQELSEAFGVTCATIRRDLTQLEKKGGLIRAPGGAIKIEQVNGNSHILLQNENRYLNGKIAVAKKAAELIGEGDTIVIDSGAIAYQLAKELQYFKSITVISNAINVAMLCADYPGVNMVMPGGILKKDSISLVGVLADQSLKNYYCDKLFLEVDGFDIDFGISALNQEDAHLKQAMINISKEIIVITDSGKFHKRAFAFVAPAKRITAVVTDKNIVPENKARLEKLGIRVIVAE